MKIRISLDAKAIDAEEMEEINSIVTEAKDLLDGFERELQSLQDDFQPYGTIDVVGDDDKAWNQGNDSELRPRLPGWQRDHVFQGVAAHGDNVAATTTPNGIKEFIYSEKGTQLMITELASGPQKGKMAIMWPSGGFLHNDRHTSSHDLWKSYEEANVPHEKRAV